MSAEVGASIPVNYLTAFQMMVVMGSVRPAADLGRRMRVLVHGASGGVGTACADIGKVYGVELFGTASPGKHAYVRERGYDHAIDYRHRDFVAETMRLTQGEGVDLVLDAVGGRGTGAAASTRSHRQGASWCTASRRPPARASSGWRRPSSARRGCGRPRSR